VAKSKRHNKSHRKKKEKKRRRRRLTAAQKKTTNSLVVCREKKKKRTNANEFCLFYAQFYVRTRLNDTIFDFFLLCARLCVVSGKRERERERESRDDDVLSVVCGRLSLFPFFVVQSKRRKIEHKNEHE